MADYDPKKYKEIGQYKWNDNPYTWNNIPWKWNDVPILMEILAGGGLHGQLDAYQKLDKRKKKRVIELIVTIKGERFDKKQQKIIHDDIKVTSEDIQMLIESAIKIGLIVEVKK